MALVPAVAGPIATLGGVVSAVTSERGREIIRGLKRAGDWIRENNPGGRAYDEFHTAPKRGRSSYTPTDYAHGILPSSPHSPGDGLFSVNVKARLVKSLGILF